MSEKLSPRNQNRISSPYGALRRQKLHQRKKIGLKRLIQEVVIDYYNLVDRGLRFIVNDIETIGRPLERIHVWATLYFLPLGSPFCCSDPTCHLPLFIECLPHIDEAIQHRLNLPQEIQINFKNIVANIHEGVLFDDWNGRSPTLDFYNIDARDALGRTALMRATLRGHQELVELLLEAGADPEIRDYKGQSIADRLASRKTGRD